MSALKMPKTVAWILSVSALLLLLMSLYRLLLCMLFTPDTAPVPLWQVLVLGLRYDARWVAAISAPLLLLGLLPGLHLYKRSTGKWLALIAYTVFAGFMMALYGLDFAHLISFNERVDGQVWAHFTSDSEQSIGFRQNAPWMIIVLLAGVGTWLLYFIIHWLHRRIGKPRSSDDKAMRLFWQVLTLVLLLFALYGRPATSPLSGAAAAALPSADARKAALNPFETLLPGQDTKKPAP
ncbi:MAG: hypothetical protein MUF62_00460 [Chitinophagaceae bacterium]|nr:hypothetical protein [Chitinophagaceae bacterium]